jgi:hypothetical protein
MGSLGITQTINVGAFLKVYNHKVFYFTVTLLAKLRGISGSIPRKTER